MERISCIIHYDGTNYSGFQIQPNSVTIQEKIEKALLKIHKGASIRIIASGRTDAGVHAMGQVIHFDSPLTLKEKEWKRAMQTLLPSDILVHHVQKVDATFHSQHHSKSKEYRYFVLNRQDPDIFNRQYVHHVPHTLNIDAMEQACAYIKGTHDFTSFCSMKTTLKGDKVRTVTEATCTKNGDTIEFVFKGNGFLYNMVRILVGTLLNIGKGKYPPIYIKQILEAKDRNKSGATAPAHGLFLWEVTYE
ncbi:tRNA pseudouridine(38-40) synthase TruA [Pontibacillus litoralis]|uniref:tRNA pseudouridine synthase A n=1 Tax=Pontibacillus litoralis JSM 072002 TaxID=1385512 RepID=A0A0A5G2N7_9BACI|nr:tRNA pseudouridine(38-40) synthase TruA [Pontibacillus litoralis]KGX85350.1 tRNA pseudouridine synthase A [Pontibacillus litoralis JSM 072002]